MTSWSRRHPRRGHSVIREKTIVVKLTGTGGKEPWRTESTHKVREVVAEGKVNEGKPTITKRIERLPERDRPKNRA